LYNLKSKPDGFYANAIIEGEKASLEIYFNKSKKELLLDHKGLKKVDGRKYNLKETFPCGHLKEKSI
jgi:hypothetical protein